jgi:hypothetical protein
LVKAEEFDQCSLHLNVNDVRVPIAEDGLVELPLEIGHGSCLLATARRNGLGIRGELVLTPTIDDDGKPISLSLN